MICNILTFCMIFHDFVKHLHVSWVKFWKIVYFFWRFYMIFSYICIIFACICQSFVCFLSNFWKIGIIFKVFACSFGWFCVLYGIRIIILGKILSENQIQKWLTVIDTNQFGYRNMLYSIRMSMRIYMLDVSFHVTCNYF